MIYSITKVHDYEIDFLIKEDLDVKQLIQVTYTSGGDEIEKREIKSLVKASDELECKNLLIITWDYEDEIEVDNSYNKMYSIVEMVIDTSHPLEFSHSLINSYVLHFTQISCEEFFLFLYFFLIPFYHFIFRSCFLICCGKASFYMVGGNTANYFIGFYIFYTSIRKPFTGDKIFKNVLIKGIYL